jgi:hypothetical protein
MARAARIVESVSAGPIGVSFTSGGRLSASFSLRPVCSSPPLRHSISDGFTPYSSSSRPRAQSAAVI